MIAKPTTTLYYGSAFLVERFTSAHILAQADTTTEAWGIHLDASPRFADAKRSVLAAEHHVYSNGTRHPDFTNARDLAEHALGECAGPARGRREGSVRRMKEELDLPPRSVRPDLRAALTGAIDMIADGRARDPFQLGNLYTVEVPVDHEKMLNWSACIRDQPEFVRDALAALGFDRHGRAVGYEAFQQLAMRIAREHPDEPVQGKGNQTVVRMDMGAATLALQEKGLLGVVRPGSNVVGGEILGVTRPADGHGLLWQAKVRVLEADVPGGAAVREEEMVLHPTVSREAAVKDANDLLEGGAPSYIIFAPESIQITHRNHVPYLPEFQAWFAGSKVVNDQGEPLLVCLGTAGEFGEDMADPGRHDAYYFHLDPIVPEITAGSKGEVVYAHLRMKNPLVVPTGEYDPGDFCDGTDHEHLAKALGSGHDGVIYVGDRDHLGTHDRMFVVFDRDQISVARYDQRREEVPEMEIDPLVARYLVDRSGEEQSESSGLRL